MDFAKNLKQQIKIIMYNIYLYVWGGRIFGHPSQILQG